MYLFVHYHPCTVTLNRINQGADSSSVYLQLCGDSHNQTTRLSLFNQTKFEVTSDQDWKVSPCTLQRV